MQALLDWNPTFAKAASHYAMSAEKQEFLIEYCNFVKHMASMVTDSPVKIQPDAIIDFTTRIPVGPFFVHNVPQACPENWPFGDFFGIGWAAGHGCCNGPMWNPGQQPCWNYI